MRGLFYYHLVDIVVCFYEVDTLWESEGEVALSFSQVSTVECIDFDKSIYRSVDV